jgi:hypothetical protein
MADHPERFAGLYELFRQAEVQLKQTEQIDRNLTIPAINELRYVAFHLLRALSEQDSTGFDADIERAENHASERFMTRPRRVSSHYWKKPKPINPILRISNVPPKFCQIMLIYSINWKESVLASRR